MITRHVAATQHQANPQEPLVWGPEALRRRNARNRQQQSEVAKQRPIWTKRNAYYYELLARLLQHVIEPGRRVLNVRCQTGLFLAAVKPSYGVGVDISPQMINVARRIHPQYTYYEALPEDFAPPEEFDYVLLCDVGDIVDVQRTLTQIRRGCTSRTRLVIYNYNHLWEWPRGWDLRLFWSFSTRT